jgi:hypothetical protein
VEQLRTREGDQPLPVKTDAPYIQDQVVVDICDRTRLGIQRYGTGLQAHNGRDGLQDLYEELLDAIMYTKQLMLERPPEREIVFREIDAERARQDVKWGEQNHVDFDGGIQKYVPKAWEAQRECENAFERGEGSWGHILFEEVAEVFDAKSQLHLEEEIIQVMAVCEGWLQCIRRRNVDPE